MICEKCQGSGRVHGLLRTYRCACTRPKTESKIENCSDCKGSGVYLGFSERKPCPTCRPGEKL